MQALSSRHNHLHFHLFTQIPDWFFANTGISISYHPVQADIGFVQRDALHIDLPGTLSALRTFLPFDNVKLEQVQNKLGELNCEAVLCDISTFGISVAKKMGIPSILMENFTWEWIYANMNCYSEFAGFIPYLGDISQSADIHIQLKPFCEESATAIAVNPVARKPIQTTADLRDQLGLSIHRKIVMLSMGGTPHRMEFLTQLSKRWPEIDFIISGHDDSYPERNLRVLPGNSGLDHPSLVVLADLVIAKLGYSTLAETYWSGKPTAVFTRPNYPEMPPLEQFLHDHMHGVVLNESGVDSDGWINRVDQLIDLPIVDRAEEVRGEEQCAEIIAAALGWS